jgi:hydrogenase expression/formation protein HypC
MCLAVPARIIELGGEHTAIVEIAGVTRSANVAFIEDPRVGDYVLLHAGFAIQKWSPEDVREYSELLHRAAGAAAPEGIRF